MNSIQIHHDGNLHWVCSRITTEGIFLYDSYYSGRTSEELDIQLSLLYAHQESELKVNVVAIQQQRGGADCGVFATAVCLAIYTGEDPANVRWRQANMRMHLKQCIESEIVTPFPTIRKPNRKACQESEPLMTSFLIELWCVCRLPQYAFQHMVECTKCRRWFHKPCVNLPDDNKKVAKVTCPICPRDK